MESAHVVAIAAIPATLLVVAQAVQGTAQSLSAINEIQGDEARKRIRLMAMAAGGAVVIAAGAASAKSHDPTPVLAAAATAAIVVYAFNRITIY